jgi:hypothetical protein
MTFCGKSEPFIELLQFLPYENESLKIIHLSVNYQWKSMKVTEYQVIIIKISIGG